MLIPSASIIYLLYREINDQMGTSEVVGVYSSAKGAENGARQCKAKRTFVKLMLIDPIEPKQ